MSNEKIIISRVLIEKYSTGYKSSIDFDFYSEKQFTKISDKIVINESKTYRLAIRDISKSVKDFVSKNREPNFMKLRKAKGWN